MKQTIIFKPKKDEDSSPKRNQSIGEKTLSKHDDPIVMQNFLKDNVRIIRGVGAEEETSIENMDKINELYGRKLKSSKQNSKKSPSRQSDSSKFSFISSDQKSNLKSTAKLQ